MAKVTIRKGDAEYEVSDLTFEELKELVGANGYGHHAPANLATVAPDIISPRQVREPNFAGFLTSISDRGRTFVETLRHYPQGIEANLLAGKLGYKTARQIGGLLGGGLAKAARKHGIKLAHVYRPEITTPGGKRTVTFFPGKFVLSMDGQKPAI